MLTASTVASGQYLDFSAFQRGADMAREQNQRDIQMQQQLQYRELELQRLQQISQQEQARRKMEYENSTYGPSIPAVLISTKHVNSQIFCQYGYFEMENKKEFTVTANSNGNCAQTGQVWPSHNRFRASPK